jgi:hypothetical protein
MAHAGDFADIAACDKSVNGTTAAQIGGTIKMDSSGHLRQIYEEDLMTMEDIVDPVDDVFDIPDFKLEIFRILDRQGNRKARQEYAKKNNIDWGEYQIYRKLEDAVRE